MPSWPDSGYLWAVLPAGAVALTHPLAWRPFCFSSTPGQLPSASIQRPTQCPLVTSHGSAAFKEALPHLQVAGPQKHHVQIGDRDNEGGDIMLGMKALLPSLFRVRPLTASSRDFTQVSVPKLRILGSCLSKQGPPTSNIGIIREHVRNGEAESGPTFQQES